MYAVPTCGSPRRRRGAIRHTHRCLVGAVMVRPFVTRAMLSVVRPWQFPVMTIDGGRGSPFIAIGTDDGSRIVTEGNGPHSRWRLTWWSASSGGSVDGIGMIQMPRDRRCSSSACGVAIRGASRRRSVGSKSTSCSTAVKIMGRSGRGSCAPGPDQGRKPIFYWGKANRGSSVTVDAAGDRGDPRRRRVSRSSMHRFEEWNSKTASCLVLYGRHKRRPGGDGGRPRQGET